MSDSPKSQPPLNLLEILHCCQEIGQELDWNPLLFTVSRVMLNLSGAERLQLFLGSDKPLTLAGLAQKESQGKIRVELYPPLRFEQLSSQCHDLIDQMLKESETIPFSSEAIQVNYRGDIEEYVGLTLKTSQVFLGLVILENVPKVQEENIKILQGLIPQIVNGLNHAKSYQQLQEFSQGLVDRLTAKDAELQEAINGYQLAQDRFSKAFLSNPNPITITRLEDGKHIEINDTFCQLTGYTRPEIIGHTATELNLWVSTESRMQMFEYLKQGHHVKNYEFEFRTKSGEIRTALLSAEIITLNGEDC